MNLIVESIDENHRRFPAFATDRVISLSDIAMYTDAEDVPLMKILATLRDKEEGKRVSIGLQEVRKQGAERIFCNDTSRLRPRPCARQ